MGYSRHQYAMMVPGVGTAPVYGGGGGGSTIAGGPEFANLDFTNLTSGQSITSLVSFWGAQGTGAYAAYGCFGDTSVKRTGKSSSMRMSIKAGSTGRPGDGTPATDGDFGFGWSLPVPVVQGGNVRFGAWMRMPSGFQWTTNTGHAKLLRLEKSAGGKHEVQPLTALWIGGQNVTQVGWYPIIESNAQAEGETNHQMSSTVLLQADTWHWIEYYCRITSVGANAIRRFWVDDVMAFEILGDVMTYIDSGGSYTTTATWAAPIPTIDASGDSIINLMWSTYWNGGAPQDQSLYLSNALFSNNNETASDMTTDSRGNNIIGKNYL